MTDDQQAQPVLENETLDAPMPSAEQKTPSPDEVGTDAPQEVTAQDQTGEGLPDSLKERTKREFEKLKGSLAEERQKRMYYEGVFTQMNTPKPAPLYNPETGEINEQAFVETQRQAYDAQQRAQRAEELAQKTIQDTEARETFQAHPELNPDSKDFDKELHVATRRILLDSMLNPDDYGSRQISFKEAGDLAKMASEKFLAEARKKGAQEAIDNLAPKEQASLEAQGTPGRRNDITDLEELRQRTRKGDADAVVARLKALETSK